MQYVPIECHRFSSIDSSSLAKYSVPMLICSAAAKLGELRIDEIQMPNRKAAVDPCCVTTPARLRHMYTVEIHWGPQDLNTPL